MLINAEVVLMFVRTILVLPVLIGRGCQLQNPYSHCSSHYRRKMSELAGVMVKIWKVVVLYPQISTLLDARNSQVVPFYQSMFFHLIEIIVGILTGNSILWELISVV